MKTKALLFLVCLVLASCNRAEREGLPTQAPMRLPVTVPLPEYLNQVRPAPGSIISQAEYLTVLNPPYLQEGPPPPPVEDTGYRSSICIELDMRSLVGPGDDLVLDKDVLGRTTLAVDGVSLRELTDTEYLAVVNCCPQPLGFGDDPYEYYDWDWNLGGTRPADIGFYNSAGYWFCYYADLGVGVHEATFRFRKSIDPPASYSWSFAITE